MLCTLDLSFSEVDHLSPQTKKICGSTDLKEKRGGERRREEKRGGEDRRDEERREGKRRGEERGEERGTVQDREKWKAM